MEKRLFGVLDCGKKVYAYTLKNEKISLTVLDYGATIQSLTFEDRDVVLGYDTLEGYVNNDGYLGAVVGRVANRISGSSFKLNGKKYSLYANDGKNSLHGGKIGFDKVVWAVADIYSNSITFQYLSPDKEEGYPGNLLVKVKYYIGKRSRHRVRRDLRRRYRNKSFKSYLFQFVRRGFGRGSVFNSLRR